MSRMSLTERIKLSTEPLLLPLVKVLVNLNVHPNVITLLCFWVLSLVPFLLCRGGF